MIHDGIVCAATVVVGILLFVYALVAVVNRATLPGELAAIERLREDAASVGPGDSEDVVGQATVWNQKIARSQAYNRLWWADPVVPDAWDGVQRIPVPRR